MFKQMLDKCTTAGAQFSDLYYLETKEDKINFTNNKLESISSKNLAGFSLQVKRDGKLGVASSSNFNKTDDVVNLAMESSKDGDNIEYDFNHPQELPQLDFSNDSLWERSYEEYIKDGENAIQLIKDYDSKVTAGILVQRVREIKNYLNSYGCDYSSTQDGLATIVTGKLVQGESILEISDTAFNISNNYSLEEQAKKIIEQIKLGRIEKTIDSGKMPVILSPNVLAQFILPMSIGLSGEYIRMGVSPLKDKIGQQVFSEMITLIDDMTLKNGLESALFDDEGTPAQKTVLYEQGVLKNYLLNLKSASALNMQSNGKASKRQFLKPKEYDAPAAPQMSNWIIEPGNTSFADMIADIKEGILIDSMSGLIMGNILRGDLDSDIEMCYKIENGKLVGRVKDAAVGMNIYEIFKDNLVALGNEQHMAVSFLGNIKTPYMMLKDINIVV